MIREKMEKPEIEERFRKEWKGEFSDFSLTVVAERVAVEEGNQRIYRVIDVRCTCEGQRQYAYTILGPNGRFVNLELFQSTASRNKNVKFIRGALAAVEISESKTDTGNV